jgi:CheY-like chemotaxis protein
MRSSGTPLPAGEPDSVTGLLSETRTVRVLLAEDDQPMRELLVEAFEGAGYEVTPCRDGLRLASRIGTTFFSRHGEPYDVIVSDIRLPGVTGLGILGGLRDEPERPPMVLITAFGDAATHREAARLGAAALLDKPFEIEQLLGIVAEVVEDRSRGAD